MKTPVQIALEQLKLPFEKLHKFQEEDINHLALLDNSGLFLDLGLGKTIISIVTGAYKLITDEFDKVLVLCPAVLVSQWHEVIEATGASVTAYAGTPTQRKKLDRNVNFLVMSYNLFQNDYDLLKTEAAASFIIVDECTVLCNPQNILFKMLQGGEVTKKKKIKGQLMPEITKRVFKQVNNGCTLLTATPVNKPTDAYGLIKILTPDVYRNFSQFLRIHVLEYDYFDQPTAYDNLDLLKENLLLNAVMRSAKDHIDLPKIIFKTIKYDLHPSHLKLYNKLIEERMITLDGEILIEALQATSLYNWCQKLVFNPEEGGYEKDSVGLEVLDGLVESVPSFLVFGNYRMSNGKFMKRYDIGASYGDISSKKKAEYLAAFKDGSLRGLTCHTKSGGYGLNLYMCQNVFFPEIPITPRDYCQAIGRVYRQGQKGTVVVVTMVARKTIQETLFHRILEKDDLMREVVSTPRSLREDLQEDVVFTSKKTKAEIMKELKGGI